MGIQIFNSRHTEGATGDQVKLTKGEHVTYQLDKDTVVSAIIDSQRISHDDCPNLGYEAYVIGQSRQFLDGKRIYFTGQVPTKGESR